MTRLLVIGTVPPAAGRRAETLGRVVADHLGMGDSVEVWSPDVRSVAHLHDELAGLRFSLRLLRASGRFDAIVLRVQNGMPFRNTDDRLARALAFLALGWALRRFRQVTIHLDSPIPIPGGVGGRPTREVWARAHVVVETEEDRERMLAVPWLDERRVSVRPVGADARPAPLPTWPKSDTPDLRSAVMDVVRARARAGRQFERAGDRLLRPRAASTPAMEMEIELGVDLDAAFEAAGELDRPRPGAAVRVLVRKVLGRVRRLVRKVLR